MTAECLQTLAEVTAALVLKSCERFTLVQIGTIKITLKSSVHTTAELWDITIQNKNRT